MLDPFCVDADIDRETLLPLLMNYQFLAPIYHSDGFGHIQEEIPLNHNRYGFPVLIEQIELMQLWPDLIAQLAKQPEPWIIDFVALLRMEKGDGALHCLWQMSDFILTPALKLDYIISCYEWPWLSGSSQSTLPLIDSAIEQLALLKAGKVKQDSYDEWEFEMIAQSLEALSDSRKLLRKRVS